jgi:cobalt-zinc-cadmium efflux system outer membrane protein
MRTAVLAGTMATLLMRTGVANGQTGTDARPLAERYLDTRDGLSVAQAVSRALQGEPSLRASRSDIDRARGLRMQAGLRPNPSVSVERREEPVGTDSQTTVQIEWPLDLFRLPGRVTMAEREVTVAERALDDRVRLLVADVRSRYGQAAAAVRDLGVADTIAAAARRNLELLRQRVEAGASPPLERDLLDVELGRVDAERLLALGRADAAMFELKRTLGMSPQGALMLRDSLESLVLPTIDRQPVDAAAVTAAVSTADADGIASARPDVREAEARLSVAEARIDRARREGRVDVALFGSYMRMDAGFPQRGVNEQGDLTRVRGLFNYVTGGAMVTVPLRNRNQGELSAAQAERAGAAARLESAQLAGRADIATTEALDVRTRQAVALLESSVRLARQNLDVVRQTYELGRGAASDVLMEQRRYLDVERAYTDTLRMAYEARTALQRARGEL